MNIVRHTNRQRYVDREGEKRMKEIKCGAPSNKSCGVNQMIPQRRYSAPLDSATLNHHLTQVKQAHKIASSSSSKYREPPRPISFLVLSFHVYALYMFACGWISWSLKTWYMCTLCCNIGPRLRADLLITAAASTMTMLC